MGDRTPDPRGGLHVTADGLTLHYDPQLSLFTLTPQREADLTGHPSRHGKVLPDPPQLRLIEGGGLSGGNTRRKPGAGRRERRWLRLVTS